MPKRQRRTVLHFANPSRSTRADTIHPLKPVPVAQAVAAALCGLALYAALPSQALAQTPAASQPQDSLREYRISVGPLAPALREFASAANLLLAFTAEQAEGKTTNGLNGRYTLQGALDALLVGSGLQAVRLDNGSYVLREAPDAADEAGVRQLRRISVVGTLEEDGSTEGTGSYTIDRMSTATGLALSIRETPQSVTVITRQRIEDQNLVTASDVLKQTPGISISASAPYREIFFARGFRVENVTFDGLAATGQWTRFGALVNDMAIYDRVEVVRGATGLTQGAGTPSASINFVRKRPTGDFQSHIQGQAGSWNHYNAAADVSGSLNASRSLRGRAVLSYTDADSFMDVVDKNSQLYYAIGEADITPNTLLTVGASHQKNDSHNTYGGLPTAPDGSDLHLPRSAYFGTKWNFWNDENTSVFSSLERRFDNQWKVKLAGNLIRNDNVLTMAGAYYNGATSQYDYQSGLQDSSYERAAYDLTASGPFKLFDREHEAVLGAEIRVADHHNETAGYWPSPFIYPHIDVFNFNRDVIQSDPYLWTKDYFYSSKEKQSGIYGAVRLNPTDRLKVIGGLRYSRYEFKDNADWYYQGDEYQGDDVEYSNWGADFKDDYLVKYAGIIVAVDSHHSLYASYTDIFEVQSQRDASNEQLDPIEGVNYEIGAKGEYFDGALNVAAALFRVDQKNLAMAEGSCPFRPTDTCYRAAGMVRSEGYDLEINGNLTPNWSIGGGYSYVSKKVEKDADPAAIGVRQDTHLPTRQLKLASSHKFLDGKARVGGSLRWQNTVWHYDDWEGYDYNTRQGAYAVADLMLGYQPAKNIDVQLNVSNLLDKWYYSSINPQPAAWGGNAVYGEPRKFMLTAKHHF